MISAPNVHSWQGVTLGSQLVPLVRPCPDTLSNSLDTGSGRHLSYHPEPWVQMQYTGMKNLNSWESESQPLCLLNTPTTQRIFWAPPPMHPSGVLPSPSRPRGFLRLRSGPGALSEGLKVSPQCFRVVWMLLAAHPWAADAVREASLPLADGQSWGSFTEMGTEPRLTEHSSCFCEALENWVWRPLKSTEHASFLNTIGSCSHELNTGLVKDSGPSWGSLCFSQICFLSHH